MVEAILPAGSAEMSWGRDAGLAVLRLLGVSDAGTVFYLQTTDFSKTVLYSLAPGHKYHRLSVLPEVYLNGAPQLSDDGRKLWLLPDQPAHLLEMELPGGTIVSN